MILLLAPAVAPKQHSLLQFSYSEGSNIYLLVFAAAAAAYIFF